MFFLVASPFSKYSGKERGHSDHKPLKTETSGSMYTLLITDEVVKNFKERNEYF